MSSIQNIMGKERAVERVLTARKRAVSAPVRKADGELRKNEYRLHDLVKRLDFLKNTSKQKTERISQLKEILDGGIKTQEEALTIEQLKETQISLENEQERVNVQVSEADTVKKQYQKMLLELRGEAATHRTSLDELQMKLAQEKDSLKNLRGSRKNAERTRDSLRERLHDEEELVHETKREREKRLMEYRRRSEERRQADAGAAADRRMSLLRSPQRRDSPSQALGEITQDEIEEELNHCLKVFTKLKEVLGVTDVDEVVGRLQSQAHTREHLRQMRGATLEEVSRVKEEKEQLQQELHRVKYASTEDAARQEEVVEELREALQEQDAERDDVSGKLDGTLKVLAGVRAGLEHIAEKLESPENERPAKLESPLLYLNILMQYCSTRAEETLDELCEINIEHKLAEMADEEHDGGGMMTSPENIRVAFMASSGATKATPAQVDDGGDSGEEEEAMTRKFIKRQAQMIIEAKARKRNRPVTTFKS